ncbi:MAG: alpha/beta hydrolase [Candidatus Zixiibacteriota bacterium]
MSTTPDANSKPEIAAASQHPVLTPAEQAEINTPTGSVREEHRYLIRDGKHLFCAEYAPVGGAKCGVVLCAPFAEEKIRTLRVYVSFARALARRGVAAVCFDYYGDGDSEGSFEDASFDDRLRDISAVFSDFQGRYTMSKITLFGLRWGGTLAALSADVLKPAGLILWEPVVDTSKYFFDHLRSQIASQMLIDGKISQKREQLVESLEAGETIMVEGYNLRGEFFVKARDTGLKDRPTTYTGPTLVVQLAGSPARLNPELEALAGSFAQSKLAALKREFEWEKTELWQPTPPELFGLTLDFMKTHGLL